MNQYDQNVLRTESPHFDHQNVDPKAIQVVFRAYAHMAQAVDAIKRAIYYGKPLDKDKLEAALGETLEALEKYPVEPSGKTLPGYNGTPSVHPRIIHSTLGLCTEVGEIMEKVIDSLENGTPFDFANYFEEHGDISYYRQLGIIGAAALDSDRQWSHELITERNAAKLQKRYEAGFSSDKAHNRDLKGEQQALEGKACP